MYSDEEIKNWMIENQKESAYADFYDLAVYCAMELNLLADSQEVPLRVVEIAEEVFVPECKHSDVYANDRSQTVCRECGEELGR